MCLEDRVHGMTKRLQLELILECITENLYGLKNQEHSGKTRQLRCGNVVIDYLDVKAFYNQFTCGRQRDRLAGDCKH